MTSLAKVGQRVRNGTLTATVVKVDEVCTTIQLADGSVREVPNPLFVGEVRMCRQAWVVEG